MLFLAEVANSESYDISLNPSKSFPLALQSVSQCGLETGECLRERETGRSWSSAWTPSSPSTGSRTSSPWSWQSSSAWSSASSSYLRKGRLEESERHPVGPAEVRRETSAQPPPSHTELAGRRGRTGTRRAGPGRTLSRSDRPRMRKLRELEMKPRASSPEGNSPWRRPREPPAG